MKPRWAQTIEINEEIARHLLQHEMGIEVKSLKQIGEGWDNIAYLVNETMVFRFPRREFGLDCMKNEIALLPYIAKYVNFPMSAPKWIGEPTEIYPYPYAGYPVLKGVSLTEATDHLIDDEEFAVTLAGWLKALHAIPVTEPYASDLTGTVDWRLDFNYRLTRFEETFKQFQSLYELAGFSQQQLFNIVEKLKGMYFPAYRQSYLHGDMYHRHVIVDPQTLQPTGLIDWGDIQIGHPAIDLGVGMIFTPSIFKVFLKAYGKLDEEAMNILLFNAFFSSMSFLPYAFEQDEPAFKHWAVLTVKRILDEMESS